MKSGIFTLRQAYKEFQRMGDINALLTTLDDLHNKFGTQETNSSNGKPGPVSKLNREDLRLICFDFVTGG